MGKTIIGLLREAVRSHPDQVYMKERRPEGWVPTFAFLPQAFSEENGTMNSSLKMVRRRIVELYQERIRGLYDAEEDPLNPANREVLRSWLAQEST